MRPVWIWAILLRRVMESTIRRTIIVRLGDGRAWCNPWDAELVIELESRGRVFGRCPLRRQAPRAGYAREGSLVVGVGQMMQHFELQDLQFEDAQGLRLRPMVPCAWFCGRSH